MPTFVKLTSAEDPAQARWVNVDNVAWMTRVQAHTERTRLFFGAVIPAQGDGRPDIMVHIDVTETPEQIAEMRS